MTIDVDELYGLEPDIDEELGIEFVPPDNSKCSWEQDIDSTWYTECSEVYMEDNATDIKHCPYCGKHIVINNEEYNEYNME